MPRLRLGATFAVVVLLAGGCSQSRELGDSATSTTFRVSESEDASGDNLSGGSESAAQMQQMIDRLLVSTDPCAILTQRDIRDIQLDPTAMASSAVRQVVAKGVVEVYNHLAELVTDTSVNAALLVQRDTFVKVLNVVERYSSAPASEAASAEIAALAQAPAYVAAETTVNAWVGANCG